MNRQRYKTLATNMMLMFGSLLFCFITIEIGYRVLDPFPFFYTFEINMTEHGNLSIYDEKFGWKGSPSSEVDFITENHKSRLAHNRSGFRDIEHNNASDKKPTIVFLGDSFTWGYGVEFEEMFVNRLRDMLPNYEIYNLAHRGYGTDQAFLTFGGWVNKQPLKLVILMFSENDVADNNSLVRYRKSKPKFQLVENELVLTGVPVPTDENWAQALFKIPEPDFWKAITKNILFSSHFLHDIYFRYDSFRGPYNKENESIKIGHANKPDLTLTFHILEELNKKVQLRGAKLVVGLIPSKREIEKLDISSPYQIEIAELCQQLDIEYLDLAQNFKNTWYRTYYRTDMHWNASGHMIAAEALYPFLKKNMGSEDVPN